ncbi:hypothetical protein BN874_300011 [Candidatus Contendobacter odensis Run_B_J11]|uniref:Uncharacterized protein n=1 Tax=Candidatus Contendobacter odensis Run_B_J11 TaxID=1400861 RepID=A0A7U7GCU5_9GAMM|nr:hypothetical protein BN874_300011 [Candidatus Contendobacter odensis Run_B_J11]
MFRSFTANSLGKLPWLPSAKERDTEGQASWIAAYVYAKDKPIYESGKIPPYLMDSLLNIKGNGVLRTAMEKERSTADFSILKRHFFQRVSI